MAKVVVEYNLDSPEDRSVYDLSSNAWRYKRILNKAVTLLGEHSGSKRLQKYSFRAKARVTGNWSYRNK